MQTLCMAYETSPAEDPRTLLKTTRELARRVRREQRGAWFPLLVFAAATFGAVPFYRYGPVTRHCTSLHGGGYVYTVYPTPVLWYWPVALLLAYVAISWFYVRRARQRGVGTRARPFVVFGVLLGLLATAWTLWAMAHPAFLVESLHLGSQQPTASLNRAASPAGVIGLALLSLAWIERSRLLLAITTAYLMVVVMPVFVGSATHPSRWAFLPHVLLGGGVLLLGGVAVALTQRARGQSAT